MPQETQPITAQRLRNPYYTIQASVTKNGNSIAINLPPYLTKDPRINIQKNTPITITAYKNMIVIQPSNGYQ